MTLEATLAVPETVARARILAGIHPAEVHDILSRFHLRRFDRETRLVHEGDPADTYYLLVEGQVKILQTSAEGFEVILHILGPGDLVGALPNLTDGTYPASAVALSNVVAYAIASQAFDALLEEHTRLAVNLLRFAAERLRASHARLREMATERVERRIARTLGRLASQIGRRTPEGITLGTPLSRQDLAEMCGTTLFTVSRTLKQWERDGILRAGREQVTILDTHALVAIGEDLPRPS
jgi:CRP-like cAMP-binding protein